MFKPCHATNFSGKNLEGVGSEGETRTLDNTGMSRAL